MASSSGTKEMGPPRSLSRRMTRAPTIIGATGAEDTAVDSELMPSSLAPIAPLLCVANEVEKENPRVAYLCRFHAFENAYRMDPKSSRHGVRQFKTYLLHRLEREEEETKPQLEKNDPREIQKYYQNFYEKNIKEGKCYSCLLVILLQEQINGIRRDWPGMRGEDGDDILLGFDIIKQLMDKRSAMEVGSSGGGLVGLTRVTCCVGFNF